MNIRKGKFNTCPTYRVSKSAGRKGSRAGGLKMASSLSVADRLRQRFNLLPENAAGSNCSIDEEIISAITYDPELEIYFNTDPDRITDPEKIYIRVASGLSISLFECDIQTAISEYIKGKMWERWSEGERELFINENIKQLEEKEEEQIAREEGTDELDKALDQVTGHKTGDFEKEIGERQQVKDIINSVSKVEIITGITNKDPGYWRFHILGEVFEIPAANLVKYNEFETMYFTKFGNYLPSILTASKRGAKDTPWRVFLKTLRGRAVMVDPMESTEMIEIGIIIDEIASEYQPTKDPEEWIKGSNMMLEVKDEYYLITPKKMKELADDLHIKTELGRLSDIMSQRGIKRPGNPNKSVMGKKPRAWWFKKEFIDSHKNATEGDDDE